MRFLRRSTAEQPEQAEPEAPMGGVSRRGLLGLTGAGILAGATGTGIALGKNDAKASAGSATVPFYGAHQAGIATPVQDRLHFAAFDVTTRDRAELIALLKKWTAMAAQMCAGQDAGRYGAVGGIPESPPEDTGEALGLPASRLTLTIGFGPSLFDDRFGLADRRPPELRQLPLFPGDMLEAQRSDGDLVVQACADDPQVAVHAIRNLARAGFGKVSVRWSQLGFGKTSSTTPDSQTPRDMFGFKDGTANISGDDNAHLDRQVWAGARDSDQGAWLAGGSYLVARRIRMQIETWDRESLGNQEQIIGRTKGEGAPLHGTHERDTVRPASLPATSHVALMHPDTNGGIEILRRGYSFVDGSDGLGRLDAGLFFISYQRDPIKQFVPLMLQMTRNDALQEYLRHTSSGVWACPPGVQPGGWWGETLFA